MRVTREKLINLAREESERRGQTEDVISGYLIGSVAGGDPIIGGSADIDLVLIHHFEPGRRREIIPLSNDIHFDITHHSSEVYRSPPELRIHPWLGPSMCEPIFLYDPDHFFERVQAGVRGQFHRSDYTQTRSLAFLERAWNARPSINPDPAWVTQYACSALEAVNALTTLGGFPVAGRKISILAQSRLIDLGYEELFLEFLRLLGADSMEEDHIADWITAWEDAFDAASYHDPLFNPVRKNYYLKSFLSFIDRGIAREILWSLMTTWSGAMQILHEIGEGSHHYPVWGTVLEHLGLSPKYRVSRDHQLEGFLDHVEEILEMWK